MGGGGVSSNREQPEWLTKPYEGVFVSRACGNGGYVQLDREIVFKKDDPIVPTYLPWSGKDRVVYVDLPKPFPEGLGPGKRVSVKPDSVSGLVFSLVPKA